MLIHPQIVMLKIWLGGHLWAWWPGYLNLFGFPRTLLKGQGCGVVVVCSKKNPALLYNFIAAAHLSAAFQQRRGIHRMLFQCCTSVETALGECLVLAVMLHRNLLSHFVLKKNCARSRLLCFYSWYLYCCDIHHYQTFREGDYSSLCSWYLYVLWYTSLSDNKKMHLYQSRKKLSWSL